MNSCILFLSVLHNEKNIVNLSFPLKRFSFAGVRYFCLDRRQKDVGKGNCHLCTHCSSVCLEIVFAVEFKQVLLKNKCKDSSEGLGEDRGVFPIESLVCFAYCVYFIFFWDICVQGSNV